MKIILTLILSILMYSIAIADDGYKITLRLNNNTAQKVYLCCYYGNEKKILDIDSANLVPGNQTIVFRRVSNVFGGLYNLNFKNLGDKDFIINNKDEFSIAINNNDLSTMTFSNSTENTAYFKLKNTTKEQYPLEKNNFIRAYPTSIATVIMLVDDAVQALYKQTTPINHKKDFLNSYLHDKRLIISPILDSALTSYIKLAPQHPDSFNIASDYLLQQLTCNEPMYKYIFKWLVKYITLHMSNGMDESYPYLVNKYITPNNCTFLDSNAIHIYKVQASKNVKLLLNKPAPNIILKDMKGEFQNILASCKNADYTLLAFFDDDCNHCKKRMPEMDKLADSLATAFHITINKFSVINAITTVEKWKAFFENHQIATNWINTEDFDRKGTYREDYNAYSNPSFFLIDRKGIIVGKELNSAGFILCVKK